MIVKLNVLITDKDKKKTFLYLTVQLFSPSVTSIMNFLNLKTLITSYKEGQTIVCMAGYSLHGPLTVF